MNQQGKTTMDSTGTVTGTVTVTNTNTNTGTGDMEGLRLPSFDEDSTTNHSMDVSASASALNLSASASNSISKSISKSKSMSKSTGGEGGNDNSDDELLRGWSYNNPNPVPAAANVAANVAANINIDSIDNNNAASTTSRQEEETETDELDTNNTGNDQSFHLNISYDASEESNANDNDNDNTNDISFHDHDTAALGDDGVRDNNGDNNGDHLDTIQGHNQNDPPNANANANADDALLDQIAIADFPTMEVTVDSSSCMSASDYDLDHHNYNHNYNRHNALTLQVAPVSPLTPSIAERKQTAANRKLSEAKRLMNVFNKVSSKHHPNDYNDIDMGPSNSINAASITGIGTGIGIGTGTDNVNVNVNIGSNSINTRTTPTRSHAKHNHKKSKSRNNSMLEQDIHMQHHLDVQDSSSSSEDDSSDTTPTRNQRLVRSRGYNHNHGNNHRHSNANSKANANANSNSKANANHRRGNSNVSNSNPNPNNNMRQMHSPISVSSSYQHQHKYQDFPQPPYGSYTHAHGHAHSKKKKHRSDPTLLAQTFVLSLAFFAIWSPQNLMAPNLTQMASYFHFTSEQRDLYLGANIAFATGVLSLPVQTLLGFLADVVPNRKNLFAVTVMVGGVASILTGYSKTYAQLYISRFLCGGCMSGSVPIAFSMLGDLFEPKDRNSASSGLTAMMGAGILFGQVFAGMIGDVQGWKRPFYVSGTLSIVTSFMVLYFVREPVRGGKEKVLQEMIANGTAYDRKLTMEGFLHAMTQNKTNVLLMLQSFSTSVPWGIIFTFLNDYFSQEQGMTVAASTVLILWFGLGCASGGIIGGAIGTQMMRINRAMLPLFMAFSTVVGILPFLGLLDLKLNGASLLAIFLAFMAPCIANLPSVNVRPCILNVNPPETRGAAMTAANMMVNVARGFGPSLVTLSQRFFGASRQYSFNLALIVFWSITTVLLVILAKTLPHDQDAMDAELERYAASKISRKDNMEVNGVTINGPANTNENENANGNGNGATLVSSMMDGLEEGSEAGRTSLMSMNHDDMTVAGEESIVSIEERWTSFDASALHESWNFIGGALREIAGASHIMDHPYPDGISEQDDEDGYDDDDSTGQEPTERDRLIGGRRT